MAAASLSRPTMVVFSSARSLNIPLRPSRQALQYMRSLNASPSKANSPSSGSLTTIRYASHQAQGRANGVKDGPGKRLGAKKTGEQLVVPGNIIYRQRGTLWFPGENCAMGRDHTIYATEKGFVKYYRDPARHPKRKYIGVALRREWSLPTPSNAPRRRTLGMLAIKSSEDASHLTDNYVPAPIPIGGAETPSALLPKGMSLERNATNGSVRPTFTLKDGTILKMRENYMFREDNWRIGRVVDKNGAKIRTYRKGDRWLAWRKRTARRAQAIERNSLSRQNKGKKKKAQPRIP